MFVTEPFCSGFYVIQLGHKSRLENNALCTSDIQKRDCTFRNTQMRNILQIEVKIPEITTIGAKTLQLNTYICTTALFETNQEEK